LDRCAIEEEKGGGGGGGEENGSNLRRIQTDRNIKIFNILIFVIAQKVIIVKQKIYCTVVRWLEMQ
jgi:hypothetical protein